MIMTALTAHIKWIDMFLTTGISVDMFPHTDKILDMFLHTGDIHTAVSVHVETICLLVKNH